MRLAMTRGTNKFRQREITRTLKAAKAAGVEISSVEVDPITGKIVVNIGTGRDDPKLSSADAVLMKLEKLKHGQQGK
jgi:hypothetical protein